MSPSPQAIRAAEALERTLGGTGWPNSLKHQVAFLIDAEFQELRDQLAEVEELQDQLVTVKEAAEEAEYRASLAECGDDDNKRDHLRQLHDQAQRIAWRHAAKEEKP